MSITFKQFKAGLRQVESGGNYHVVNSIGAVGAYQVMKANIPSWTKRALGYSMTWQQFRDSPKAQEKVADTILGGYFRKYGAEGAASMWFSGQPNPNSTRSDGGNTVRQYVDKVMSAAGSGGYSATSSASSGGTVTALDDDTLAAEYGLSRALINSSRELKSLFKKAVSGGWTASRFQASLRNTKWWTTQSTTLRQYLTQKYEDPATFKQKNSAGYAKYNSLAVQVGLGSQISKGAASRLLKDVTYKGIALGWSDARIKDYLGSRTSAHDGVMWGEAGEAFDKLHELTYANGVTHGADWYAAHARAIVAGRSTIETQEAGIRKLAAAKYSAFAEQIKAGQNALDLAAPYISSVSTLLELPETDVDLKNKYVSDAMTGAKAGSTYPLWEFENKVRSDPLWKKTNNARESMMGTAHQVLQNFGMAW